MVADTALTILVIEDDPGMTSGLARLLRREGHTVATADNGQVALTLLLAQRYDVLLCDLLMPVLNGPDFYAHLRLEYPALARRVIFVTGDTLNSASMTFLEQCGRPWLRKPCTIAAVRQAIQQLLAAGDSAETP
jgi:CheY-like chemotaxis protein